MLAFMGQYVNIFGLLLNAANAQKVGERSVFTISLQQYIAGADVEGGRPLQGVENSASETSLQGHTHVYSISTSIHLSSILLYIYMSTSYSRNINCQKRFVTVTPKLCVYHKFLMKPILGVLLSSEGIFATEQSSFAGSKCSFINTLC